MKVPECGFRESPDGSIAWGSSWEPGDGPAPVCIVYHFEEDCDAWIPFTTWTRDPSFDVWEPCCHRVPEHVADRRRCSTCGRKGKIVTRRPLDEHDCDWIAREKTLYHHESGGGCGSPTVSAYAEPGKLPGRIWIAEGEHVVDGWADERVPLSDDALLEMGYQRVRGPTPDPFAGGIEGDTFYDERTGQRYPDDDGKWCCCCDRQFVQQTGDLIALDDYEIGDDEVPGLYRTARSWDRFWVAPLPANMSDDRHHDEAICPKCVARTVADFRLRGLVDAWVDDREAMPEEHRESLLDAVRVRVDKWISGYAENREPNVHAWYVGELAPRLNMTEQNMHVLLEEAGYP